MIFISKPGEWAPRRGDYPRKMTDELSDKNGANSIQTFIGAGPKNMPLKKCVVKGISLKYKKYIGHQQ